eukprot:symbB.v1.2.001813.t1/scaffold97.1/size333048/17
MHKLVFQFGRSCAVESDALADKVLNKVGKKGGNATEFLRLLCARSRWGYEQDERIRPALEALKRAREKDSGSHTWWEHIDEEHKDLVQQDAVRVIMSEYLCLTAHIEARIAELCKDLILFLYGDLLGC